MKHALTLLATFAVVTLAAALLASLQASYAVYVQQQIDPKFGAAGTVHISMLIGLASGSLAALGATSVQLLGLLKKPSRPVFWPVLLTASALTGALIALLDDLIFKYFPIMSGVGDLPQYCVYFFVCGVLLHTAGLYCAHHGARRILNPRLTATSNQPSKP